MPSITRDNIGKLKPTDLLGAVALFQGKYENEE